MAPHIVILGGGFAGLSAAVRLAPLSRRGRCRLTLISASPRFVFIPSLPWLVIGRDRPKNIIRPLQDTKIARHVRVVIAEATGIDPKRQRVFTSSGPVPYDKLIVAVGARADTSAVPGLARFGWGLATLEQAQRLARRLRAGDASRIVVAVHSSSPCRYGLYEMGLLLARQGRRVAVVTTSPTIDGVDDPKLHQAWVRAARGLDLEWHTGRNVAEVRNRAVLLDDGTVLDSDVTIAAPPPRAPELTAGLYPAVTRAGLVVTHDTMQCVHWDHVYAAGDVLATFPPPLASIAELTGSLAAHNCAATLELENVAVRSFHPFLPLLHYTGQGWGITGYYRPAPGRGLSRRWLAYGRPIGWAKQPFRSLWMAGRL